MKEISLTQGKVALVDDSDFEWLSKWKWCATKDRQGRFYAIRDVQHNGIQKRSWMHREILRTPADLFSDHINGDGLDNQRHNLRVATRSQNQANRSIPKHNTSGFKGVTWDKTSWKASIAVKNRRINLGRFKTIGEAATAYKRAAIEHFGSFCCLRLQEETDNT